MAPRIPSSTSIAALFVAVAGCAMQLSAFWPGMMEPDAAYLWWQARGGELDTVHSPLLVLLWRALLPIADSPAPLFALFSVMFWTALWMIAATLPWRAWQAALFVALTGFAPPVWVLLSQVGTDVPLVATLALATACLLRVREGSRGWLVAALALLGVAAGMRLNAGPALLPLTWLLATGLPGGRSPARRVAWTASMLAAMFLVVMAVNRVAPRQVAVWPATAMWDLAAISIATDRVLLPPDSVGPDMTVEDLAQAFRPWTNTTLFAQTRAGVRQPFLGSAQGELKRSIAGAWWRAVREHPVAYIHHRWRVVSALWHTRPSDWPRELAYAPGWKSRAGNPPIATRHDAWHRYWMARFEAWRSSAWLAAWPWILLYPAAFALAWPRRRAREGAVALGVLASGALYALPLAVVAPGAELRYLGWTFVAGWLAAGIAVAMRRPTAANLGVAAMGGSRGRT